MEALSREFRVALPWDMLYTDDWVHRKCSGIKGSMYKVMKTFICRGCVIPVTVHIG